MEIATSKGNEMKNFADMFEVSWEHEYFTDSDAASFDTLDEANAAADRLRAAGKRRVTVSGPGIVEDDDDLGF